MDLLYRTEPYFIVSLILMITRKDQDLSISPLTQWKLQPLFSTSWIFWLLQQERNDLPPQAKYGYSSPCAQLTLSCILYDLITGQPDPLCMTMILISPQLNTPQMLFHLSTAVTHTAGASHLISLQQSPSPTQTQELHHWTISHDTHTDGQTDISITQRPVLSNQHV